jgi:hypothetical protein
MISVIPDKCHLPEDVLPGFSLIYEGKSGMSINACWGLKLFPCPREFGFGIESFLHTVLFLEIHPSLNRSYHVC